MGGLRWVWLGAGGLVVGLVAVVGVVSVVGMVGVVDEACRSVSRSHAQVKCKNLGFTTCRRCPYSARTVPVHCPYSARTVPVVKN